MLFELDGEVIQRADPHIGLLHRATEKLAETKTYIQSLPYMDRLDYVSMMCNEHAYCLAVEKLLGIEVPDPPAVHPRDVRRDHPLLNHLMWLGCHGLDCGAMNILIYTFREREDLVRHVRGGVGRGMHAAYFRPGGVYRDLPDACRSTSVQGAQRPHHGQLNENRQGLFAGLHRRLHQPFPKNVDEYESLLTDNRIWKQRTVGIGVVTPERA